jgi:hypothetical protein
MGKNKLKKKKAKTKTVNPEVTNYPPYPTTHTTETSPSTKKGLWKRYWGVVVGIGVIVGILASIEDVRNLFLGKHEKYVKEKFVEGDLKPPRLPDDSSDYIVLEHPIVFTHFRKDDGYPIITGIKLKSTGTLKDFVQFYLGDDVVFCPKSDLNIGIRISVTKKSGNCTPSFINFVLKDDRIYVSVEFKDLLKEETVGVIEYNHWKLCKENMFDFKNTDEKLEVRDKQNNIVFL